jgi:hypothetical protein
MRDQDIMGRFNAIEGMAASDIQNIQRQTLLLRTRIDAIERLLFASRWGILRAALIQIVSPISLAKALQAVHAEQIKRMNEAIADASKAKPAVKPAPVTLAVTK